MTPATLEPHERLLLCGATPSVARRSATDLARLLEQGVDWGALVTEARVHRITPGVRASLTGQGDRVPASVLDELAIRGVGTADIPVADWLRELKAIFDGAGIAWVPYKGPELAALAYGDCGLREYGDLDVLVRPADLSVAVAALEQAGYPRVAEQRAWPGSWYRTLNHEYTMRGAGGLEVDLHWRLAPPYLWRPDLAFMFDRLTTFELDGTTFPCLSPEDTLLMVCVHGTRHAWQWLRLVTDVACVVENGRPVDFGLLLADASRTGSARMVGVGLALTERLLGVPIPPAARELVETDLVIEELVSDRAERIFANAGVSYTHSAMAPHQLRALTRRRDRRRFHVRFWAARLARVFVQMCLAPGKPERVWGGRWVRPLVRPVYLLSRYLPRPSVARRALRF